MSTLRPGRDQPGTVRVAATVRDLQGSPAGVVSRLLAASIDLAVVAVVLGAGYLAFSGLIFLWHPSSFSFPRMPRALVLISAGAVLFVYLTAAWATTGRTYGAEVVGLRVLGRRRGRVPPLVAVVRALFCVVFPIGLLWCAVDRRNASVQDLLTRTTVVYAWEGAQPGRRRGA